MTPAHLHEHLSSGVMPLFLPHRFRANLIRFRLYLRRFPEKIDLVYQPCELNATYGGYA